jgi:hypothetical protein
MYGGKKKEKVVHTKAYVLKTHLNYIQTVPVPEDLENWIEVELDPNVKYIGKIYDTITNTFIEDVSFSKEKALNIRKEAYKERSDPLFLEWQFDQTEESETIWRNEVAAIKAENPIN